MLSRRVFLVSRAKFRSRPYCTLHPHLPTKRRDTGQGGRLQDWTLFRGLLPPSPSSRQFPSGQRGEDGQSNHLLRSFIHPSIHPSTGGRPASLLTTPIPPIHSVHSTVYVFVVHLGPASPSIFRRWTNPSSCGPPQGPTGPRGREGWHSWLAIWRRMDFRAVSTTDHTHKTNASSLNRVPWDRSHGSIVCALCGERAPGDTEQRKRHEPNPGPAGLPYARLCRSTSNTMYLVSSLLR